MRWQRNGNGGLMSQGTNVESDALRAYARAAESAADRIAKIRGRTATLDLSDGTFGQLPEANSLRADYIGQKDQSGTDLEDSAEMLRTIAEAVRGSAENYDANEDETARGFGNGA
ncbi:hypothetical protein SRIMHP_04065 [Streptomyces rimosus subsp. rimosus]|nr:hypothetical protein SRIMR7_38310 [Streptomyces rimosus subsp. rimosus]UTH93289.1 hypothetical protein SRIMHP_04065 [Streptomyces rimosus subsp. rimosus]UTJ11384.1 hypothetical protein SRIMDV3_03960 [Streptomyces rimosus subsp. rimosus]